MISTYSAMGWKAPFRISSTAKGEMVHPGIYYIAEDIVAVNAGGGRPFREGWAARYAASPVFRKMVRDLSWFWSVPGLVVAVGCTVVVVIHPVPKAVAYGVGMLLLPLSLSSPSLLPLLSFILANELQAGASPSSGPAYGPLSPSHGSAPPWHTRKRPGKKTPRF